MNKSKIALGVLGALMLSITFIAPIIADDDPTATPTAEPYCYGPSGICYDLPYNKTPIPDSFKVDSCETCLPWTPTPSPTETPCNPVLEIGEITDVSIATPRSGMENGWRYKFGLAGNVEGDSLGTIVDNANVFTPGPSYTPAAIGVKVESDGETVSVTAEDYLTVTHDGGAKTIIYFPALSETTTLYVGADGATYTDIGLCTPAQLVPTATPTETPVPTPTNTATPSPTSTPNASQWYGIYGPAGSKDVVKIGSVYAACSKSGEGQAGGHTKTWHDAMAWADALVWLSRSDWRLPTQDELVAICYAKNTAANFTYNKGEYWSSFYDNGHKCVIFLDDCYQYPHTNGIYPLYVIAVRTVDTE